MACAAKSRFMFVEYSAPTPAVKGQKKRRGSPSDVRAHITKEFHRRLRVKRVDSLRGNVSLPERRKTSVPSPERGKTSSLSGEVEDVQDIRDDTKPPSAKSPTNLSRIESLNEEISLRLNFSRRLSTVLGEGRMDPFDVLPSQHAPLFLNQVLDHGMSKIIHMRPARVVVAAFTLNLWREEKG